MVEWGSVVIPKRTIKLFGVAGSGKTTRCTELIKEFVKTYPIEEITFTTYTKAGIRSIKEKLIEAKIVLPQKNYFNTLHSICWELSQYQHSMLKESHYREFFKSENIDYTITTDDDVVDDEVSLGQHIKLFYEWIQDRTGKWFNSFEEDELRDLLNKKYQDDSRVDLQTRQQILIKSKKFSKWKQEKGLYTFSDCFVNVLEKKINLPTKILIIDEAQDLFYSQIQVVKMWITEYERDIVLLAGDDDQAVHEWAGSDPTFLINFQADEKIILEESHRVPSEMTSFINELLGTINHREQKKMFSMKTGGKIEWLYYPRIEDIVKMIDPTKKTFLLFRTNKFKREIADWFFKNTIIPFGVLGGESKYSGLFCFLANGINKLSTGQEINSHEADAIIKKFRTPLLLRGIKTNFSKENKGKVFSASSFLASTMKLGFQRYESDFDLKRWLVMNVDYEQNPGSDRRKIEKNDMYRKKLLDLTELVDFSFHFDKNKDEKGENRIYTSFNVNFGTFHSSKGLQAESVFAFLTASKKTMVIDDSERRCAYVASTRASRNTYLVQSSFIDGKTILFDEIGRIYRKSRSNHQK